MVEVTCAVIIENNKVLAACRPMTKHNGGLWEFPGGKIHLGETSINCIIREIEEELKVIIEIIEPLTPVEFCDSQLQIRLIPFLAKIIYGEIAPQEHTEIQWASAIELKSLQWSPADVPVVNEIINHYL